MTSPASSSIVSTDAASPRGQRGCTASRYSQDPYRVVRIVRGTVSEGASSPHRRASIATQFEKFPQA
ncbi:hypothetical protein C8Q70DRAFT_386466 [Cubamyces menziesii]|nr:hypothetical protein C8Q70DRAFT_386466 [Cubamyces menziesii]